MSRYFATFVLAGLFVAGLAGYGLESAAQPQAQQPGAPPTQRSTQGSEQGIALFEQRCAVCHMKPGAAGNPIKAEAMRELSPERIYQGQGTVVHAGLTPALTADQKMLIAEFMAGRPLGSSAAGDAKLMPNRCASNPAMTDPARSPSWNGWSPDLNNNRFQTAAAAGLTAAQVPQLKLKWAFGFPTGISANSQPSIVSGRVFVGSDNGFVYSLDARTGCVYWSFENGAIIRNAVTVGPVTRAGSRYAAFFGDGRADIFAVDAESGKLLWKTKADPHWVARITAGTRYYDGKLFVSVSSSEEFSSGNVNYPCCTSRGSVVALDANTGKEIWKSWIVDEPKAWTTQSNGVTLYRPAGGAVWNAPTIDPVKKVVYVGTGDATAPPQPKTTDGVVAIDIETGKILWAHQAVVNDIFMGGCTGQNVSQACPNPNGPDGDIGNSPILISLANNRRVLTYGTKTGDVIGLDPDNNGAQLFRVSAATGLPAPAPAVGGARGAGPAGGGAGGPGGAAPGGGPRGAVDTVRSNVFLASLAAQAPGQPAPGAAGARGGGRGGPGGPAGGAGGPQAGAGGAPPAGGGRGGGRGSIVWGGASDSQLVFYGTGGGGLVALRPATGERVWGFTSGSLGAVPTVIPGVVFEGSTTGMLYAVSSTDGKQLWQFNTSQPFETVNRVAGAHGGSIASAGAVVVNGMVFVGSGYGISSRSSGGNVMLAFGLD